MSKILGRVGTLLGRTPKKEAPPEMNHTDDSPSRGTKRKSVADPYDDVGDEDMEVQTTKRKALPGFVRDTLARDSGDSSSAPDTPASRRVSTSRKVSTASTPDILGRRGRPSKRQVASTTNAEALAEQARGPDPSRYKPDSAMNEKQVALSADENAMAEQALDPNPNRFRRESVMTAPIAPMGGLDNFEMDIDEQMPALKPLSSKVQPKTTPKTTSRAKRTAAAPVVQAKPAEEDEEDQALAQELSGNLKILKHRQYDDFSVELQVGEDGKNPRWEQEHDVQDVAPEKLYEYWESKGGRVKTLFGNKPGKYFPYRILDDKKVGSKRKFEVQWVGHSTAPDETTLETEKAIRVSAEPLVEEYLSNKPDPASEPVPEPVQEPKKRGRPSGVKKGTAKTVKKS
ncbi:hypothetical protein F5Y16DRAFT_36858 [Xylariaceae sp. FL0255]|nr:hypothetical protein F5Y16DRAFT_36858 [Xylariaceae sp. FL0255]